MLIFRAWATCVYINVSLIQRRSELLGRLNKFKKENKYKFLRTNNGKIYLSKHETSQPLTVATFEEFEDFIAPSQWNFHNWLVLHVNNFLVDGCFRCLDTQFNDVDERD